MKYMLSDEILCEPLYAIARYRFKPEQIEPSRQHATDLAAQGPAWLRLPSFELKDNGGFLAVLELERHSSVLRGLEAFQRCEPGSRSAARSRRNRHRAPARLAGYTTLTPRPNQHQAVQAMLDDLLSWGRALTTLRNQQPHRHVARVR